LILVSACLLGEKCRFDGQGKISPKVSQFLEGKAYVGVCPEVAGGLGTPRPPAEIVGERVLRADGTDVTRAFKTGVDLTLKIVDEFQIEQAVLKARSPSCGCGKIYNGKFSRTLIDGDGLLTQALKARQINCQTEDEF